MKIFVGFGVEGCDDSSYEFDFTMPNHFEMFLITTRKQ